MKSKIRKGLTGITIVMLAVVTIATAQDTKKLTLDNYSLKMKGTSNVHDWTMEAEKVSAAADAVLNSASLKDFNNATVTVKVEEIESGKRIMNNKTYDALESDDHPNITYTLKSVKDLYSAGKRFSGKAIGSLTIAGKTNTVTIPFQGKVTHDGIVISGDYSLEMTEYNIDPPTAMLGSLTTGNEVTIVYEFTFKQ